MAMDELAPLFVNSEDFSTEDFFKLVYNEPGSTSLNAKISPPKIEIIDLDDESDDSGSGAGSLTGYKRPAPASKTEEITCLIKKQKTGDGRNDSKISFAIPDRLMQSEIGDHGPGIAGVKVDEERLILQRVLVEGLSEPTSEDSPPDGVLAVPLLRHQRIALSWMVKKETNNLQCLGGILADDQGLGKTISTIALILTERSPPYSPCFQTQEQAMNVDDNDDDLKVTMVKGRPAAGTLVVCPTSVLRQWANEIQSKVTRQANLSYLVYHGSNRTKDPEEIAKYDVVITTYAIATMEVPDQPSVTLDDGIPKNNKKKNSPNSEFKKLIITAGPLAKVGWFRVVLDEAQSIKNYKTQVARSCWGLRAKRRWCLSGTPIQNAIDDLYSYFRFLKFDPFDVYRSFCHKIKIPIIRKPKDGYKKLQVILNSIMLRRIKGSLLDGKPIICLPPKTITLKRVDFSDDERKLYMELETKSQDRFKKYRAAGTLNLNYAEIIVMLLRLRQACDHYLLVQSDESNSITRSSMDLVKELPREDQIHLLYCLEDGLAVCTICNDPPEDAVVTICGHVFCNHCICEHLIGEENICPSSHCKKELSLASIFSRDALITCLSDEPYSSSGDSIPSAPEMYKECSSPYSSKVKAALEILQSLPVSDCSSTKHKESDGRYSGRTTEKAIVFSQWTKMLDLFEGPLQDSCINYRRLDGTMSVAARDKAIKDFNTLPEVTVIIMSLKAASLGLNMVAANHVLLLDLWWNPTTEDQAIDRAHRIGQTRPVTVSRLTVKDTVEDRILAMQENKRQMVASAFGENEVGTLRSRLTMEDLNYIIMG